MKRSFFVLFIFLGINALFYLTSCIHEPPVAPPDGNYPPEVANIVLNKCAISGCHNTASYQNANGLLLDTWDHLLDGGLNGAEIIAYSPKYSPLLYITNTDSANGEIVLKPSMPLSTPGRHMDPLTKAEYAILYNWIAKGAPDKNGNIPFASDADTRQKLYLTQSGNDILAVIDGKRKVVMRYIPVGLDPGNIESQHEVEISEDGRNAYIIFNTGRYIQKIDTRMDTVVASVLMDGGLITGGIQWSNLCVAPVDTAVVATNFYGTGGFAMVNTPDMNVEKYYGNGLFTSPHGVTSNETFDTFFITAQYGNTVYKFAPNTHPVYYKKIPIKGTISHVAATFDGSSPDPHQVEMSPDFSKYFVSCQTTNEIRVVDAHTDKVLDSIPVGVDPEEMTLCESKNYLFVTCVRDVNANTMPGRMGSVYVIDINTHHVVKVLNGDFYQPHDLAVDNKDGYLFVASRNTSSPIPPHHPIPGGGNAGWYTVYDLNTLEPADKKRYEVLLDPYAMNARF